MSSFKPHVSIDVLPADALKLKDDRFFSLVEMLTSVELSQVLKLQRINSINTFLLCKNISQSILLPSSAFEILRKNTCAKLDLNNNDCYVVHVGIIGQIDYLYELFKKKQLDEAKRSSVSKRNKVVCSNTSSNIMDSSSNQTGTTIDSHSSSQDSHSKIITSIKKWSTLQKKLNGSKQVNLVEGVDYSINFPSPDTAIFQCKCQARISVTKLADGFFPLSNIYKHWKISKRCDVLKPVSSSISSSGDDSSSLSSEDSSSNNDSQEQDDEADEDEDIDDPMNQSAKQMVPVTVTSNNNNNNKRVSSVTTADWSLRKRKRL